jgi:HAE1 family hydrophobic/amphiphilic exporter-1
VLGLFIAPFPVGAGFIGAEFFAKSDRGEFLVQIEMPKDASIEQTNAMTQKAEQYLRGKKEVTKLIATVGQSSEGMGGSQLQLINRRSTCSW